MGGSRGHVWSRAGQEGQGLGKRATKPRYLGGIEAAHLMPEAKTAVT
jgi:hypothetical protein